MLFSHYSQCLNLNMKKFWKFENPRWRPLVTSSCCCNCHANQLSSKRFLLIESTKNSIGWMVSKVERGLRWTPPPPLCFRVTFFRLMASRVKYVLKRTFGQGPKIRSSYEKVYGEIWINWLPARWSWFVWRVPCCLKKVAEHRSQTVKSSLIRYSLQWLWVLKSISSLCFNTQFYIGYLYFQFSVFLLQLTSKYMSSQLNYR